MVNQKQCQIFHNKIILKDIKYFSCWKKGLDRVGRTARSERQNIQGVRTGPKSYSD
jgi:hypothetical protein